MGHIIVTGAGSGLGRALTIGLVERGHQVSMMGRRYQRLQEQEQLITAELPDTRVARFQW